MRDSVAPRTVTLVLVILVGSACALALTAAPTAVRALVVVPVLVGVAGSAATRLVLGPRTGSADDDEDGTDGLLRATLPIVLGMVALLASVLLAAVLGIRIATPGIAGSAGAIALALVGAARWRTLVPGRAEGGERRTLPPWLDRARASAAQGWTALSEKVDAPGWAGLGRTALRRAGRSARRPAAVAAPHADAGFRPVALPGPWLLRAGFPPVALPGQRVLRAAAGVLGSALVLAGAVACAIALRPVPVEQYTQIALDGPQAVSGSPLTAGPGGAVTVDFRLSGYGRPLADAKPHVDVTVGGSPARGPFVVTNPPAPAQAGTGAVDVQSGSVVFLAPADEGLYTVRVAVGSSHPCWSRR